MLRDRAASTPDITLPQLRQALYDLVDATVDSLTPIEQQIEEETQ
jgi:hypothetical protein